MIKILTVCILTILLTPALPAEVFRFRYTEGLRYNMITEVLESVYIDGAFANQAEILNKITVSVEDVREGSGLLSGTFRVSELAWGSAGPYRVTDETYHSLFWRDPRGRYSIDPQYIMPIVRNIPLFPEDSINPGESWIAEGEEVHDLRVFGIRDPLRIPLSVRYLYVGKERREEREIAVFEVSYYSTVNTREGAARGSSDWEIPEPGSRRSVGGTPGRLRFPHRRPLRGRRLGSFGILGNECVVGRRGGIPWSPVDTQLGPRSFCSFGVRL